jgi:hypothetical protein
MDGIRPRHGRTTADGIRAAVVEPIHAPFAMVINVFISLPSSRPVFCCGV